MASRVPISDSKIDAINVFAAAAHRVMERCDALALCSDEPGRIARLFCTPAMRAAHDELRRWMEAAGMTCRLDGAANLIGRYRGAERASSAVSNESPIATKQPVLLIGSHIDTVVNAGRYDGVLGVLLGIALVEIAAELRLALPFSIDVVAFSEEEGVRFASPYIGSRAMVGELTAEELQDRDAAGVAAIEALRQFGIAVAAPPAAYYRPEDVVAYIEPHIEQGPLLEASNLPVGIVTGIAGQTRACLRFVGKAGHAGTVPMATRRDALASAAEFILAVERVGRDQPGLVATVGQLNTTPNVPNVIAGEVDVRLDVRHAEDAIRESAVKQLIDEATRAARGRNATLEVLWMQSKAAAQFDADTIAALEDSVREAGEHELHLASGAGHDAAVMARHFRTAMLFVRCAGGISHHPDEAVNEADVAIALKVLLRFIERLATELRSQSIRQP